MARHSVGSCSELECIFISSAISVCLARHTNRPFSSEDSLPGWHSPEQSPTILSPAVRGTVNTQVRMKNVPFFISFTALSPVSDVGRIWSVGGFSASIETIRTTPHSSKVSFSVNNDHNRESESPSTSAEDEKAMATMTTLNDGQKRGLLGETEPETGDRHGPLLETPGIIFL